MNRQEILKELRKYFVAQEFVGPVTFKKHGQTSFQFMSTDLLETILFIRKGIDKPFYANDWHIGGIYDERGFRSNMSDIVFAKTEKHIEYLSGHVLGMALDFKVKGMRSDDVRKWIIDHADELPCKVRLENIILSTGKTITWVHLDVKWIESNPKVYLFNV